MGTKATQAAGKTAAAATREAPVARASRPAAMRLQQVLGNAVAAAVMGREGVRVAAPNSSAERAADPMSSKAMSRPAKDGCSCGVCANCAAKRPRTATSSGGGQALDAGTLAYLQPRFGYDFGNVRIHDSSIAAESARALGARAFTAGTNIVFNRGEYSPATEQGRRLLAHELAHVVQQGGRVAPVIFRSATNTGGAPAPQSGSGSTTAGAKGTRALAVDVLAAENPDSFLVQAAARNIGVDIRVRSIEDMATQLEALTGGARCVSRLSIFNHANPSIQGVAGGGHIKQPGGGKVQQDVTGFSLAYLLNNADRSTVNRLRHLLCCARK